MKYFASKEDGDYLYEEIGYNGGCIKEILLLNIISVRTRAVG
jgi:hypothetical protein